MNRLFESLESRRAYSVLPEEESEQAPQVFEDAPAMPLVHEVRANNRPPAPRLSADFFFRPASPRAA